MAVAIARKEATPLCACSDDDIHVVALLFWVVHTF